MDNVLAGSGVYISKILQFFVCFCSSIIQGKLKVYVLYPNPKHT